MAAAAVNMSARASAVGEYRELRIWLVRPTRNWPTPHLPNPLCFTCSGESANVAALSPARHEISQAANGCITMQSAVEPLPTASSA